MAFRWFLVGLLVVCWWFLGSFWLVCWWFVGVVLGTLCRWFVNCL